MTQLYVIADEYIAAAQRMEDLELDQQTIADTLEGLSGALEVKASSVAMVIQNMEATAKAIEQARQKMDARRKAIENRAESLRDYLKAQMERTGITRIESPYFVLAIQKNPPRVVVDAESLIPREFMYSAPAPPPEPIKKMIADAIKAGAEVPGVHLEQGTRLAIK